MKSKYILETSIRYEGCLNTADSGSTDLAGLQTVLVQTEFANAEPESFLFVCLARSKSALVCISTQTDKDLSD